MINLSRWILGCSFLGIGMGFYACQPSQEMPADLSTFFVGGDMSYVNEVEDCGAIYRSEGEEVDPFELLAQNGGNIMRVRLWHDPSDWTAYSNFEDVKKTIARARAQNLKILLDFHYSDTWADPQHQVIPKAWEDVPTVALLADSLYQYTQKVLIALHEDNLLPEYVQVGNETNIEIMQDSASMDLVNIDWSRNVTLLNSGVKAVKDVEASLGKEIGIMLHIAQPENAFWWFEDAIANGLDNSFEWIGLSYYPKWSTYKSVSDVSQALDSLRSLFDKRMMIVETSYIHTMVDGDNAPNILGEDSLIEGYEASPQGQLRYMQDLTRAVIEGGGEGLIYWEPAWISSSCRTLWGQGSHWDNATLFDGQNGNEALPAMNIKSWLPR